MYITEKSNGKKHVVVIRALEDADYKGLTSKKFSFNWKSLKGKCELYKLTKENEDDIMGVMALNGHPEEQRMEVKLLAVSEENKGDKKKYERTAGCLLAFAGYEALKRYDPYPCISLLPKTTLKKHYMEKYKMLDGGRQLYLENEPLEELIKTYYYEH